MLTSTSPKTERLEHDELDSTKLWWQHVQRFPRLTQGQEVELAQKVEKGDKVAFDLMVESNLRLVDSIARKCLRFAGDSLTLKDLIQEGNIGLMRAARKFDWRKGYKFGTYASYWIRQAIMRAIAEQGRSIRLPVHFVEAIGKTTKTYRALTNDLSREPTIDELAEELGFSKETVVEILANISDTLSLDEPFSNDEGQEGTLADLVEDHSEISPDRNLELVGLGQAIQEGLEQLTAREQEVLWLRYGLDNGGPKTLEEVGVHFKVSRERIRQVEQIALNKLRRIPVLREVAFQYRRRKRNAIPS